MEAERCGDLVDEALGVVADVGSVSHSWTFHRLWECATSAAAEVVRVRVTWACAVDASIRCR